MSQSVRAPWLWLAGVLTIVSALYPADAIGADVTTADVTVSIVAPPAEILSVDVTSPVDPARRWTMRLAGGQRRTFQGLIPDRYDVRVTTSTNTRADATVVVGAGGAALIEVTLLPSGAPHVDVLFRNRLGQGTEFGTEELRALPSGNSVWALLDAAAPFVITDRIDNGGLATGRWPRIGGRGASWTSARMYLGDEDVDGPRFDGAMPFYPDLTGIDSVTVLSGLADPRIGTPGTAIALVPKRPGREPHGTIGGALTTRGFVTASSGVAPDIGHVQNWQDGHLRWEGPLTARLGAVVSASINHVGARERDRSESFSSRVASFMTHVVIAPTDRDEVRLLASAQHVRRPFEGAPQLPDGTIIDERDRLFGAQISWDRHNPDGSHRGVTFGVRRAAFAPDADAATGGSVDRATYGPVPSPASRDTTRTINVRLTYAPANWQIAGLDHSARLGADVQRTDASGKVLGPSVFAELVAGVPARAWVSTEPASESSRHVTGAAFTANDDITLARRLTFTVGLRAVFASGDADGAVGGISWRSVSPLAALRWTPNALAMTAGYRRYARPLSTALLAFGDPGAPLIDVYRWSDNDADRQLDTGERGPLVARAGRAQDVASIAPDLRPSSTDEFSLRAERRVGGIHSLSLTATVRRERNLLRAVNTGAPVSAYRAVSVPNEIGDPNRVRDGLVTVFDRLPATFGQDHYVLSNVPGEGARHRGLELVWEMRSARWHSLAGASAYESSGSGGNRGFRSDAADQGVIGELFENPNAQSYVDSRTFFDRGYVLKWSTAFRGPGGVTAGVTARYQDGQPFARMVLVRDLAQGAEMIASDYSVATRFSFTGTIDIRLAKTFTLNSRRATARVDVFNLSNLADEVEENSVSGPTFRAPTAMQPTRTIRIGLEVDF